MTTSDVRIAVSVIRSPGAGVTAALVLLRTPEAAGTEVVGLGEADVERAGQRVALLGDVLLDEPAQLGGEVSPKGANRS